MNASVSIIILCVFGIPGQGVMPLKKKFILLVKSTFSNVFFFYRLRV